MKLRKIEYQSGYLWVDETRYSDHGGLFYVTGGIGMATGINQGNMPNNHYCFKVVAQSPNLSLPNIPYLEVEEYESIEAYLIEHGYTEEEKSIPSFRRLAEQSQWTKGYKSASVKKWSDEDMFGFAEEYAEYILKCEASKVINPSDAKLYLSNPMNLKKRKYSLQPKIESVEIEMEQKLVVKGNSDCFNEYDYKPITYQKDDKTFLKVKQVI
jgi:hypothetical protein